MGGDGGTRRTAGAESARRVLDVLFSFRPERPEATVKDIAAELGIPLPSAHRYVALLRDRGLITESERGRYHLTLRVSTLADAAHAATNLTEIAHPHLRELRDALDETVLIAQLVGSRTICMHRLEASRRLRLSFEPGQSLPPFRGASVKVLVGALPEAEREAYIDKVIADRPSLESQRKEFEQEVALAAERQWATSFEEIDEGVWAAAALIRERGRGVAALSVPCPHFRVTEARRQEVLEHVNKTAHRISRALNGEEAMS